MFEQSELKAILSTLTQRRAWLLKNCENPDLADNVRKDHINTLKLLDSGMKKLAKLGNSSKKQKSPEAANTPAQPSKASKRTLVDLASAYVLIAEDSEASSELLKSLLNDIGIDKIDVVEDGRAAVKAIENSSPAYDIILCDWEMPEMNGIDVHKSVKTLAKLRDSYFFMVTGNSEKAHIREAVSSGVDGYIVKPVDTDVLKEKIKALSTQKSPAS